MPHKPQNQKTGRFVFCRTVRTYYTVAADRASIGRVILEAAEKSNTLSRFAAPHHRTQEDKDAEQVFELVGLVTGGGA